MSSQDIRNQLLQQNGVSDASLRAARQAELATMVEIERERMRTIRIMSVVSWVVCLCILLALPVMLMLLGRRPMAVGVPVMGHQLLMLCTVGFGALAFVAALATTAWLLFRSRTASLGAIEARLVALEQLIQQRASAAGAPPSSDADPPTINE